MLHLNPNPTELGSILLIILFLISAYLLSLKIRDSFKESPDPKSTYTTLTQFEHLYNQYLEFQKTIKHDFQRIHELLTQNSQHIAALLAQYQHLNQRTSELSLKTDKLLAQR